MKTALAALILVCVSALYAGSPPGETPQPSPPDQVPEGLARSDWQSIRAAYEAGRHAFQPVEGGWQARNPGQQWTTKFDKRGFLAQPRGAEWQWGLELKSYGFSGAERAVAGVPAVKAAGQRLTYAWNAAVQEWWVNDTRGLEHGFTVKERPAGAPPLNSPSSTLNFLLAVRGTLMPVVTADALGVEFRDAAGTTVLNYSGLKVWDADRKVLASRFVAVPEGVRLMVEERGARYPITVDPVAQQAYLKPLDSLDISQAGDRFGDSVAVSGDTVVVGAPLEDSSTTGVNGTPNEGAIDAGAAYVFTRSGGVWTQQAFLKPAAVGTTQAGDQFGSSVSIEGDTIVVGALNEDGSTTGVNDTPSESAADAGAAYVFTRSGTAWSQQAYLKASQVTAFDYFGNSVAVAGDTVVVGAYQEDGSSPGVNGAANESALSAGAAFVFVRSGTSWSQQAYLKASQVTTGDFFGVSVAVTDETVVVGASREDGSATGVNGPEDEGAAQAGAAYVFVRNGTTWSQQAYLKASQVSTSDNFGAAVAVAGDTVVVGALAEDGSATGVDGPADEGAAQAGAAYVFVRSGTIWSQQAYLKASQVTTGDNFGAAVAVAGDTVVVGALAEDGSATGVDCPADELAGAAGAAYVFVRSGTAWTQQAYLKPSAIGATQVGDSFGKAVAVAGDTVVVGAPFEDSSLPGVIPDELANDAGAAGVFLRTGTTWTQQAFVKPSVAAAGVVGDGFGYSVAVSGDTVVVGAPSEDSSTTGVNSPTNESASNAGAAFVFVRNGTSWTQQAYLKPAAAGTTQENDQFGNSVSISADTVVVGAPLEGSSSTGVNSTPNESASGAGAAYVFTRSGSVWTQQAYLKPAAVGTTQAGDEFGYSVSVAGDTVVVGALFEGSSSTGVNSTPNESASQAGAAYVFVRSGTTWTQKAYLKPAAVGTTQASDLFGLSVAVAGDTVVVGAPFEGSSSTGVNSTPNESAQQAGAAYVFTRSGTIWTQQAYLKPAAVGTTQSGDQFGRSVATAGDTVVVGAYREDSSTTGVNGFPNELAADAGAVCVFTRIGTTWTQQAYLKPAAVGTTQSGDNFGFSVAISGDTVVVGAPTEDSSTTGVISTADDVDPNFDAGAAYVFSRSGTTWAQRLYLKPAAVGTTQAGDQFGLSVATSGDTVVVGASGEDSNSAGVNSMPDELASSAGAAYVFTVSGIIVEQPAGTFLFSGVSSIDFGPTAQGDSAPAKTFTVRNLGPGTLAITSVSALGGDAGDFAVNTAGMLTSVPVDGSTTFAVTFTPAAAASRASTLRIVNSDAPVANFDIALTGLGLSFTTDSDADGLNDASERQLSALGYDWQVSQPALVNALFSNTAGLQPNLNASGYFSPSQQSQLNTQGYFTTAQVQALHIDTPLIQRDPGTGLFTLTLGLGKSTNLAAPNSFIPLPFTGPDTVINGQGKIEFQFTVPDDAAFFRLEAQ